MCVMRCLKKITLGADSGLSVDLIFATQLYHRSACLRNVQGMSLEYTFIRENCKGKDDDASQKFP